MMPDIKNLTLKEIIDQSDTEEILLWFLKDYPKEKLQRQKYREVIKNLKGMKTDDQNSNIQLVVKECKRESNPYGLTWMVYGTDLINGETIAIEFCPWNEWLAYQVDDESLGKIGKERYISHCIRTMTLLGTEETDIDEKFNSINVMNNEEHSSNHYVQGDENDYDNFFIIEGIRRLKEVKKPQSTSQKSIVRPWIRLFARSLDLIVWGYVISRILDILDKYLFPDAFSFLRQKLSFFLVLGIYYYLWIFLEAVFISKMGFTFGKWLMGITVKRQDGSLIGLKNSLKRSILVVVAGRGFEIPFLREVFMIFSFFRLKRKGMTMWDETCSTVVRHEKLRRSRCLVAVFIYAIYLANMITSIIEVFSAIRST